MPDPDPRDAARWQRLLVACRKGLNHDLTNQLVAFQGLLQLLAQDEADHLSLAGQDYVRRLLGVAQRTQALARVLRDLSRLGDGPPRSEVLALPELAEEVVAALPAPADCSFLWDAPRAFAPRELVKQALAQALPLAAEAGGAGGFVIHSRPAGGAIELSIKTSPAAGASALAASPDPSPADLPATWHDRLECVLLRELADTWYGGVTWHRGGAGVSLTLPAPP
jgi:hypothetical protein